MVDRTQEQVFDYEQRLLKLLKNDDVWAERFASFYNSTGYQGDDESAQAMYMAFLAGMTLFHDLVVAVKGNPDAAERLHQLAIKGDAALMLGIGPEEVHGHG